MNILFVSDNAFLCHGVESHLFTPRHLPCMTNITEFFYSAPDNSAPLIVAFENTLLRNQFIMQAKQQRRHFIVLLPNIVKNTCFKINGIMFSSIISSTYYLKKLMKHFPVSRHDVLSPRENEIVHFFYMPGKDLATMFNMTVKNISSHRTSITRKLNITTLNSLALARISTAFQENQNTSAAEMTATCR